MAARAAVTTTSWICRKTVQPLMNALCIADNIKLEYQEVTDPYTKEKYFEYAHDGKLMGRLLIPSNPENQE
jgi:predicted DNA-binding transcriptional regulator YafY